MLRRISEVWQEKTQGFREAGTLPALTVMIICLAVLSDNFLTPFNLLNVMRQTAEVAVIAVGMTFLIICRQFDLSVGSTFGLAAVFIGVLVRDLGFGMWPAFFCALLLGALIGLINGLFITRLKIPSFIATLGMMGILRGAALVLASGYPISEFPESSYFDVFSLRLWNIIPVQALWMVIVVIIGGYVLARTVFGYEVYATGSNERAAHLSGINTDSVQVKGFIITGVLSAFAGAMMMAHLGSATPLAGAGLELDVIAAVVIGGTALSGGVGSVLGTFLGAVIMAMLRNGLVLLGVSSYWQVAAIGFVILVAVYIDTLTNKRGS